MIVQALLRLVVRQLSGIWRDVSAQGTYDQCIRRGPIKDMPLIPGCAVFMYSASKNVWVMSAYT